MFVHDPSKREGLPLQSPAPTIDSAEHAFQDGMTAVCQWLTSEHVAKHREIMIASQQLRQLAGLAPKLLLATRPYRLEQLQAVPEILRLFATLV